MSVYTFSTRAKFPKEAEVVAEIKKHCEDRKLNFSRVVIEALTDWRAKHESRFTKVPDNSSS